MGVKKIGIVGAGNIVLTGALVKKMDTEIRDVVLVGSELQTTKKAREMSIKSKVEILLEEYQKIQAKQSTLSRVKRDEVVHAVQRLIKDGYLKEVKSKTNE